MSTFARFAFRDPADESDDPDRAVSQSNCLAQLDDTYASEPDERIACTLEKEFDEQSRTDSPTIPNFTLLLSHPSAGAFHLTVQSGTKNR